MAVSMKKLEPLILVQSTNSNVLGITNKTTVHYTKNEMTPLFSIVQEERLDTFLTKFKTAFESNQISDIPTSAVMELYEYKVQSYIFHNIMLQYKCMFLYILMSFTITVSSNETF